MIPWNREQRMTIAQIRAVPVKGDLETNVATLTRLLDAVDPSVDVVVTPECYADGYVVTEDWVAPDDLCAFAIDPDASPVIATFKNWAAAHGTWLVLGCTTPAEAAPSADTGGAGTGRPPAGAPPSTHNSAVLIDRSGSVAGVYHKTHIQTHDVKFVPGESLPVFDGDFGRFGILICADRRWPEAVRTVAAGGARLILLPSYGMHNEKNLIMMRTRSYESEVVIAFTHPEQALVTDARGEILTNSEGTTPAVVTTTIDLDAVDEVRQSDSAHLRDRRRDLY